MTAIKRSPTGRRARSLSGLALLGLPGPGAFAAPVIRAGSVEHRNGAGHLDPTYEAELRARVRDRARKTGARAFVSGTCSTDASAEESGQEFVMTVTIGENGGEGGNDEESSPFVDTSARVEFAYDTDESNPADGTREPFPTS